MKKNIGTMDGILRIIIGLALVMPGISILPNQPIHRFFAE